MALIRKKHSAFSDPWASNKRCQPSNRHRATVRGVYGQWGGAGCVRSGGMGRSCAWGRRLSDVCFQQKPKLQGIQTVVQRLSSGCLQPLPSHCLHSLARRAAVRCCVAPEDGCGGRARAGRGQAPKTTACVSSR